MKSIYPLFVSIILFGCTTFENSKQLPTFYDLPKGYWIGDIVWNTVPEKEGDENFGKYKVELSNCDNNTLVRISHPTMDAFISPLPFKGSSKLGNHVIYWINSSKQSGEWVENQVWNIVELSPTELAIQWARMVSNPSEKLDDQWRVWSKNGYGILKKQSRREYSYGSDSSEKSQAKNLPYC